jgi:hypothetical protein
MIQPHQGYPLSNSNISWNDNHSRFNIRASLGLKNFTSSGATFFTFPSEEITGHMGRILLQAMGVKVTKVTPK